MFYVLANPTASLRDSFIRWKRSNGAMFVERGLLDLVGQNVGVWNWLSQQDNPYDFYDYDAEFTLEADPATRVIMTKAKGMLDSYLEHRIPFAMCATPGKVRCLTTDTSHSAALFTMTPEVVEELTTAERRVAYAPSMRGCVGGWRHMERLGVSIPQLNEHTKALMLARIC